MPVDPGSATTTPSALALGNASILQDGSLGHHPRNKIPRNLPPTKLRRPLESTKNEANTEPNEAKRPHQWALDNGGTWAEVPSGKKRVKNSQSWNVPWNQQDHQKICKKHPHPKAGMSNRINTISPKWGLDPKLECPLESVKRGLHRRRERRRFGAE